MNALCWFLRSFRTLHWRLTLSYLLVTLVVVFAVEMVNTLTDTSTLSSDQSAAFAQSFGDVAIPQIAPALETSPPDHAMLNRWVNNVVFPSDVGKQGVSGAGASKYTLVV